MKPNKNAQRMDDFRTLADNLPDLIHRLDRDFRYLFINSAGLRIKGWTTEGTIGKTIREIEVPEPFCTIFEDRIRQVFATGEPVANTDLFPLDQGARYFESRYNPEFGPSGSVCSVLVISRDVTDETLAREALAESEKKFRQLAENSPDAIFELDANGVHQYVSAATTEIFGYTVEETIGMHFSQYLPPHKLEEAFEVFAQVLSGKPVRSYVSEAVRKDGRTIIADFSVAPIMKDGKLVAIQGITRDITAQKAAEKALAESEARYRSIFNSVPVGILRYDQNGVVTHCNLQFGAITGEPTDTFVGYSLLENMKNEGILHGVKESLAGRKGLFEGRHVSEFTGKESITRGHFAPVLDEDKNITGGVCIVEDISETHAAREALAESQANLETFFNAISESAFLIDTDGVILALNQTTAKRIGVTVDDMIGRVAFDFVPEKVAENRKNWINEAIRTGKSVEFEDMRLDRFYRHVIYPVLNGNSEVVRLAVFSQDIHDRKTAEYALAKSEEKYRFIFDSSPLGIIYYNAEGIVTECNPKTLQLTGGSYEGLIGLHLLSEIKAAPFLEAIQKSLAGFSSELEGKYRSITGNQESYLRSLLVPIRDNNQTIIGGLCVVEDISEKIHAENALKESEKRYRMLFENAPVAIILMDYEGHRKDFNRAALNIIGYTASEALSLDPTDIYAEPGIRAGLFAELKQKGSLTEKEIRFRKKNGEFIDTLVNMVIVQIENKSHILVMVADITRQKQTENALKDSRQKLRDLARHLQSARESERITIARELHDELGQVLTVINMEASLLAKKIPARWKTLKPGVETISEFAVGAIRSLKRILSELRPALLNDLGLAAALKWQAQEYQDRTGIRFEVNILPDEFEVEDELGTTLFRIFQESTTNILRHSKASVAQVCLEKKEEEIWLTVKDNGIGFSCENPPANESLGIMGMRERAEMLGGSLAIASTPQKGTVLHFRIPCQEDRDSNTV